MPNRKRSTDKIAFSTMALLVFLVEHTLMKQCRAKEREMDLLDKLIGFSCEAMRAHAHIVQQSISMLLIPIEMHLLGHGPCTIYLFLQTNRCLHGGGDLLKYIPQLKDLWKHIYNQHIHATHIGSQLEEPLLMDFIMFLMWLNHHRPDLWELFGHNAMRSCLKCITFLTELYLVESVVKHNLEPPPLPLLKGKKGKHRNTNPTARAAWIKSLQLCRYHNNSITQVLTRNTLPKGVQQIFEHACVVSYFNTVKQSFAGVNRLHLSMDASNHTEDTMVTAVYSPVNDLAAYASIVVMQHPSVGDLDIALKTLAAEGKLIRMTAFNHIKALYQVLQSLGHDLDHYKLPKPVIARPLFSHEVRFETAANKWVIMDTHTDIITPQIPADFTGESMPLLVTCIDQASYGLAAMQFLMESNGVMLLQYFDKYHRVSPQPHKPPKYLNPTP